MKETWVPMGTLTSHIETLPYCCHRGPSHLESWCKAKSLYNRWVNYFNVPETKLAGWRKGCLDLDLFGCQKHGFRYRKAVNENHSLGLRV